MNVEAEGFRDFMEPHQGKAGAVGEAVFFFFSFSKNFPAFVK